MYFLSKFAANLIVSSQHTSTGNFAFFFLEKKSKHLSKSSGGEVAIKVPDSSFKKDSPPLVIIPYKNKSLSSYIPPKEKVHSIVSGKGCFQTISINSDGSLSMFFRSSWANSIPHWQSPVHPHAKLSDKWKIF